MGVEGLNILLAEDDPAHAEAIIRSLRGRGGDAAIRVTGTLREYLHTAAEVPPDIAILDLNLPDGRATAALTSPPEAGRFPVLIMTSFGDEHVAVEAMRAGALDYIVKSPESFRDLPRTIRRALREWMLLQARRLDTARIVHLNAVLRGIRSVSRLIAGEKRKLPLLQAACDSLVESMGYWAVWISLGGRAEALRLAAQAGIPDGAAAALRASLESSTPPACAKRSLEHSGVLAIGPPCEGCGACLVEEEFPGCGVLTFAMEHDGVLHGCVTAAVPKEYAVDVEEQTLFQGLVRDLAFALHSIDMARRHEAGLAEKARLEEQLDHSRRMEAVGRLAGGVAHDFNNLLSVIISYTGFAIEDLREIDPIRADLEEVRKAAERAASLTRQLLAFGRKQVMAPSVINLNRTLSGFEGIIRRLLREDITLEMHLAEDLGNVLADPGQVEQVIMNLVLNASDAMPDGGKLSIETANIDLDGIHTGRHMEARPGRYAMLVVADTGSGMDAETREHIFEPFFTTKAVGKGTGLGLSTVYGIVKQSGGHVWVYSEPGLGTTFRVYLPLTDIQAEAARRSRASVAPTGTETVLLVEDEEAVRGLAERILRTAGYQVLPAADGGEALLVYEAHRGEIDLLLTDVVMPHMSGRVLAERLSSLRPGLRVLFMSGHTDDAILHHGLMAGTADFISKPFAAEQLTRKVREVLDRGVTAGR
jgi:signal transduction histidine kinase/DNA-binding response OmpR family regulator